jgi:hypothetical protein
MAPTTGSQLDAHDEQIKQLQIDVSDIKSSLEADRVVNREFQAMVLELLKPMGKKSGDSGDGSALVFSSGGGNDSASGVVAGGAIGSGSGVHSGSPKEDSTGAPWAVKKVKLPEFTGFDPQGWIQKANLYFDVNSISDELRLRLA